MILQGDALPVENDVKLLKQEKKSKRDQIMKSKSEKINQTLTFTLIYAVNDAKESKISNWPSVMSLEEYGFVLNKNEFRDAVSLRYAKE